MLAAGSATQHVCGAGALANWGRRAVRHRRLAAPGAPGRGRSPPWTPLPPPARCRVPPRAAPMGADARGSPFPAGAEEVQTISPPVMLSRSGPTSREQAPGVRHAGTCRAGHACVLWAAGLLGFRAPGAISYYES